MLGNGNWDTMDIYINDCSSFRYTPQCANLIAKYKTTMNFLSDSVNNLETFMDDYKVKWMIGYGGKGSNTDPIVVAFMSSSRESIQDWSTGDI